MMTIELWNVIVSAGTEVRRLLDRALPQTYVAATAQETTMMLNAGTDVIGILRTELRRYLDDLKSTFQRILPEKEAGMVLYPLVLHFDEMVTRRLSTAEQTQWPLLQKELFDMNDGGDVFFEFVEERLKKASSPPLVFTVLYYCLSDGFIGKFGQDPAKAAAFKKRLTERIPLPEMPGRQKRKRRRGEDEESVPLPNKVMHPAVYYLATSGVLLLLFWLTVSLTNL